MGYTHYWNKKAELDQNKWSEEFVPAVNRIIELSDVELANSMGEALTDPTVDSNMVSLNGLGANSYESFIVTRGKEDFNFCKTAHMPYDEVCVAILMLASELFEDFEWSSDGNDEDHKEGKLLFEQVLIKN